MQPYSANRVLRTQPSSIPRSRRGTASTAAWQSEGDCERTNESGTNCESKHSDGLDGPKMGRSPWVSFRIDDYRHPDVEAIDPTAGKNKSRKGDGSTRKIQ